MTSHEAPLCHPIEPFCLHVLIKFLISNELNPKGQIRENPDIPAGMRVTGFLLSLGLGCGLIYLGRAAGIQCTLLGIVFFLIAILLPAYAGFSLWQNWQRRQKFGASVLSLNSVPATLGQELFGEILIPRQLLDVSAIRVVIRCETILHSRNRVEVDLRWSAETSQDMRDLEQKNGQTIIPVKLAVPSGCPPTKPLTFWSSVEIRWLIRAEAIPRHGDYYWANFILPVVAAEN